MKLLALSGFKRSGKDTCANYLIDKYQAKQFSFAAPLKDKVAEEYEFPREWCDDQEFKERPLLKYPVDPKDDYSHYMVERLFRECRTKDGKIAAEFVTELNLGLVGNKLAQLFWTPRALLIMEGSGKRAVNSRYWVDKTIKDVWGKSADISIIADARFKSEMEQLKEIFQEKLVTIRICRFSQPPSQDASENDLNDYPFDYFIENKGTLEELYTKLDYLMTRLVK